MPRLSTALSTSLTGLTLASRMTQTISNNVANALTEGYAAREVLPTARSVGGVGLGVSVGAVVRNVDPVLVADRRVAEGAYALASTRAEFFAEAEFAVGLPEEPSALSNQIAGFEAALIEASTRPESDARLNAVLNAAQSVATKLGSASDAIQAARERADAEIGRAVTFINETLAQIAELNVPQTTANPSSERALNRADQRAALIDQLAEFIPVRETQRDDGTVMLFTPRGEILLDSRPAELSFTPAGVIVPNMVVGGALSGLTINGRDVSTDAETGRIAGGRLAALFDVRDVQAPAMQAQLDAVARDLYGRFADPAIDPTLLAGEPGLFTDAGAAFDPADEPGFASRIAVNAAVDPAQGGDLWRLRDGINAAAPGPVGDATRINAYLGALNDTRVPASGGFIAATSAAALATAVITGIAAEETIAARAQAFAGSRVETLLVAELSQGVDTDQEMQRLLLVEQAYQANAKVISTIDELLETLIRI